MIVLQHLPVYTLGTGSSEDYLNFNVADSPYDMYRTERGGEVTYHGPGQVLTHALIHFSMPDYFVSVFEPYRALQVR